MARPLRQVAALAEAAGGCPVLYAGDIFDKWNAGPELINFALAELPRGYAIPGQHDLPNHNYEEIRRSAYWTLVEADRIINLPPGEPFTDPLWFDGLVLYGFPWGYAPEPIDTQEDDNLHVAVIHRFIWCEGTGYPGAPAAERMRAYRGPLTGYDAAHFGDNHKGFVQQKGGLWVCNSGGFMRRKTDERDYQPTVGLLHGDGTVTRHALDISEDVFTATTEAELLVEKVLDMSAFVAELRDLESNDTLDFTTALIRFLNDNKVSAAVRRVILQAQEGA